MPHFPFHKIILFHNLKKKLEAVNMLTSLLRLLTFSEYRMLLTAWICTNKYLCIFFLYHSIYMYSITLVTESLIISLLLSLIKELTSVRHWRWDFLVNVSWVESSPMMKNGFFIILSREKGKSIAKLDYTWKSHVLFLVGYEVCRLS